MPSPLSKHGLHWLPIAVCVIIPTAFFVSYAVAVVNGHVSSLFPYISDTGTTVPESCIFGQLLNMGAALAALCVYCWHMHTIARIKTNNGARSQIIFSRIGVVVGFTSVFGMSLVANFQESAVGVVHATGALTTFALGCVYAVLQTYSTRAHFSPASSMWIVRLVISVWCVIFFISHVVLALISKQMFDGDDPRKWMPTNKGYIWHALSSASEWALAFGFLAIFGTMVFELRDYTLETVRIRYRWDNTAVDEPAIT